MHNSNNIVLCNLTQDAEMPFQWGSSTIRTRAQIWKHWSLIRQIPCACYLSWAAVAQWVEQVGWFKSQLRHELSFMSMRPWAIYWIPKLLLMCGWHLAWWPLRWAGHGVPCPRPETAGSDSSKNPCDPIKRDKVVTDNGWIDVTYQSAEKAVDRLVIGFIIIITINVLSIGLIQKHWAGDQWVTDLLTPSQLCF